jgi:hypothetical protein
MSTTTLVFPKLFATYTVNYKYLKDTIHPKRALAEL